MKRNEFSLLFRSEDLDRALSSRRCHLLRGVTEIAARRVFLRSPRSEMPRTRAAPKSAAPVRVCPSCMEPHGSAFPSCGAHGCDACVTCTCTWFRSTRDPACARCNGPASLEMINAVIAHTRSLRLTTGPLRVVGAEEAARWRGEPLSAAAGGRAAAPVSPRSSARQARDFRALKREAPKLGVKPCPSCGESCQHFKNDGCHSVECGECGLCFCYVCGGTDGDCACTDCSSACVHCADVPDGVDLETD